MINERLDKFWLSAEWPAPDHIHAGISLRHGGISNKPFNGLNLAKHVNDDIEAVNKNREKIKQILGIDSEPVWLNQTHSNKIISLGKLTDNFDADGSISSTQKIVCVVLTADCVPLLLCNKTGTQIGAIHVGWKGLSCGIIENAVAKFSEPKSLFAWIGPNITKQHYEVGHDVLNACVAHSKGLKNAFDPVKNNHWLCDLSKLAKIILKKCGVGAIYECGLCTYENSDLFYSYRRDGITGRNASMIWME
ncbi:MAG: peptidoglycan editing factor PgeF [Proteobacteria bacterium]|nr:peptidoglycan editing factor PgeF [Pseudomonadota bacterium]